MTPSKTDRFDELEELLPRLQAHVKFEREMEANGGSGTCDACFLLPPVVDALPALLAERKRLREQLATAHRFIGGITADEWATIDREREARSILQEGSAGSATTEEEQFTGQDSWPCVCGHVKREHYFGDRLGSDGRMHTWCQMDGQHCSDFQPEADR